MMLLVRVMPSGVDVSGQISPFNDHGSGLRFLLEGVEKALPGGTGCMLLDPLVQLAAQYASQAGVAPPPVSQQLTALAMRLAFARQLAEQGVEDVDVLVK